MSQLEKLRTKIFADGANLERMLALAKNPLIKGFTTNPTLMRKDGVTDYVQFAHSVLRAIPDRPISFEVFADDFQEMEEQAHEIASWGGLVNVKIPVTNTHGQPAADLIRRLSRSGIRLNITGLMTLQQVQDVTEALGDTKSAFISVFAGRIADTGRDPVPLMAEAVRIMSVNPGLELIWASPRELLNVLQADAIGCHVITVTHDVLKKLSLVGKSLDEYSLETVQMFFNDAQSAGYRLVRRAGKTRAAAQHARAAAD